MDKNDFKRILAGFSIASLLTSAGLTSLGCTSETQKPGPTTQETPATQKETPAPAQQAPAPSS